MAQQAFAAAAKSRKINFVDGFAVHLAKGSRDTEGERGVAAGTEQHPAAVADGEAVGSGDFRKLADSLHDSDCHWSKTRAFSTNANRFECGEYASLTN